MSETDIHWQKPRVRLKAGQGFLDVRQTVQAQGLHTVCQSAHCPNVGECWAEHTATFMILGNVCTRACRFCAVKSGKPTELDRDEPRRVAEAVRSLAVDYAVITSVNRDELEDSGAGIWAETVRQIRLLSPDTLLELLVPDFCGKHTDLDTVLETQPEVLNHNVETVPRLYATIQPWSDWHVSLDVLRHAHERGFVTKSGIMVGLGESNEELLQAMEEIHEAGVDILTIGQYLQPSPKHAPMVRGESEERFDTFRAHGEKLGFRVVLSAPLVRSSYRAKWAYSQVRDSVAS